MTATSSRFDFYGWIDTGVDLPDGMLSAVSREPVSVDVFVSSQEQLFHAIWPREPESLP